MPSNETERVTKGLSLDRLADLGAAGQALVPGVYAWAVTVAPAAWSRAGTAPAKLAASLALVALLSTLIKQKGSTGAIGNWVFVLASTIVWVAVPAAVSPAHMHPARGVAGMLGWGVFAFAGAAPSLDPDAHPAVESEGGLKPRAPVRAGDGAYLGVGVALALALQCVGWSVVTPERAIFVRLVTVGSGVAILSLATTLATARHNVPGSRRLGRALRKSAVMLVAVLLLVAFGVVYSLVT